MDTEKITVDRKLAIPGLIAGVITVIGLTVMGLQFVPFVTRQEATAQREAFNQQIAQNALRLTTDEARIQKLEDNYGRIEQELADLNTSLARYTQQVVDEQQHLRDQRGR